MSTTTAFVASLRAPAATHTRSKRDRGPRTCGGELPSLVQQCNRRRALLANFKLHGGTVRSLHSFAPGLPRRVGASSLLVPPAGSALPCAERCAGGPGEQLECRSERRDRRPTTFVPSTSVPSVRIELRGVRSRTEAATPNAVSPRASACAHALSVYRRRAPPDTRASLATQTRARAVGSTRELRRGARRPWHAASGCELRPQIQARAAHEHGVVGNEREAPADRGGSDP